jgi:hypothetical protein
MSKAECGHGVARCAECAALYDRALKAEYERGRRDGVESVPGVTPTLKDTAQLGLDVAELVDKWRLRH